MGLEELAGKHCKHQIKMRVNESIKKVNAKIKPGLLGLSPRLMLLEFQAPSFPTATTGATQAAGVTWKGKMALSGDGNGEEKPNPD